MVVSTFSLVVGVFWGSFRHCTQVLSLYNTVRPQIKGIPGGSTYLIRTKNIEKCGFLEHFESGGRGIVEGTQFQSRTTSS